MLLLSLKKDEIRDEKWWRSTPVTSLHIQERSEDFLGEGMALTHHKLNQQCISWDMLYHWTP